jgi:uncharacterized membrane protein (UPF0182 family)
MQPFNALDRPNMTAFLVADSTPGQYGRLIEYQLPRGSQIDGTGQVGQRIDQDDEISSQFSLWRGQGSTVLLGDMIVLPVEESILYVQPVYLEAEGINGGLPEFRRVVAVFGDRIEWAETLDEALAEVFQVDPSGDLPVPEGGGEGDTELDGLPETVEELISQAALALEDANRALADGDLGAYQLLVDRAATFLEEAQRITNAAAAPVPEEDTTSTTVVDGEARGAGIGLG